ncbi:MAG TPA: alkaline phosphatase family protein [Candidatus Dormibacteraeota bacterium]
MDSLMRRITLRPIRKTARVDRVNRVMKFLGLKSGILITGTAILLIVPTVMLVGSRTPKPTHSSGRQATVVRELTDDRSSHDALLTAIARARVTPSPTPTPAPAAAPTSAAPAGHPTPGSTAPAAPRPTAPPPPPPPAAGVPAFSHVFVIVMENHEYGSIIGSGAAPYINSLANSYGLATNYYGASHPSLPNYLALTAGSTFGIASDCTTCYVSATNIGDQVEASGRSWKAYMEDMPSACYTGASYGNYAMKHDPFMYYNDIRNNAARCAAHVVPFTQFSGDMSSGNVPNFVWITPNLCNDMHDCAVSTGDNWLRSVVPTITGSAAFRSGGVLFITWDEGSSSAGCCGDTYGGQVATLVISPRSIPGYRSGVAENHYGLLRTVEDALRLSHLNAASWASNVPLREYFR